MKTLLSDITLLTAAFNEHAVTLGMLKSFMLVSQHLMNILIIDNSTTTSIPCTSNDTLHIIDNTNFKHTPNYNQPSRNHASSIQYALAHITTRYVMLCDNDILFYPSINDLFSKYHSYDAIGEIGWDITPPNRLYPYLCIFDVEKMRSDGITYFDPARCLNPGCPSKHIYDNRTGWGYMDTGASFLSDITEHNWAIHNTPISNYCMHIKGFTLRHKSNYNAIFDAHMKQFIAQ